MAAVAALVLRPTAIHSGDPCRRCRTSIPPTTAVRASSRSPPPPLSAYRGPKPRRELVADWVSNNDGLVRSLPIYVGGASLLGVLINRTFSGVAPVADASSSQSRADILTLALAVTNILAGLVWLSIQPRYVATVVPRGVECRRISSSIAHRALIELLWAWEALSSATCSRSLVVVYGDDCLLQIGVAAESSIEGDAVAVDVPKLIMGLLYKSVLESGKQSYLANLSLYPGRSELPFLPTNTQAVILQPLGNRGIAIIGGNTIRGFSNLDQMDYAGVLKNSSSNFSLLFPMVPTDLHVGGRDLKRHGLHLLRRSWILHCQSLEVLLWIVLAVLRDAGRSESPTRMNAVCYSGPPPPDMECAAIRSMGAQLHIVCGGNFRES